MTRRASSTASTTLFNPTEVLGHLARAVLALALLAAWQGALLHPLEHVDEHGYFFHLHGADGRDARGENERQDAPFNPSDRLGDLFAAVNACAPDAPAAFGGASSDEQIAVLRRGAPRAAEAPPFLAQGPPARL